MTYRHECRAMVAAAIADLDLAESAPGSAGVTSRLVSQTVLDHLIEDHYMMSREGVLRDLPGTIAHLTLNDLEGNFTEGGHLLYGILADPLGNHRYLKRLGLLLARSISRRT